MAGFLDGKVVRLWSLYNLTLRLKCFVTLVLGNSIA